MYCSLVAMWSADVFAIHSSRICFTYPIFSQPHCCRMDEGRPSVNTRLGQSTVHGLDYGLWTMDWLSEQIWIQTTPTSYYDLLPRPLLEIILSHAHFLVSSGCSQNIHPVRICMHTYSIITLLCLGLIVG